MKYHKLRIGFSAMCGILCVLLVVWLRSYSWLDRVRVGNNAVASTNGRLIANDVFNMSKTESQLMASYSRHACADNYVEIWMVREGALVPVGLGKSIPVWPLVAIVATLAVLPWIHWSFRFSLRTLLIAITLIALVLGVIAVSD